MRITPLDIRKQEFRKTMRGLDSDEVYAFLGTVADEYEAVLSDNKRLREHIVQLEERLKEFKSMETNLRNTLMTAEKVTAEAKENARKEADLIVRGAEVEATQSAEAIRAHTQQLRREILELKKHKDNYVTRLRTLLDSHRNVIDGFEEDFAEVDREIEAIGRKVEEDTKVQPPASRISRERIEESFGHREPSDKVTWGDDEPREDVERPTVPKPGQWEQNAPERQAAPPEDGQDVPKEKAEREKETAPAAQLDFGPVAGPPPAASMAGGEAEKPHDEREDMSEEELEGEALARDVVAHSLEERLYPDTHFAGRDESDGSPAAQAPQQTAPRQDVFSPGAPVAAAGMGPAAASQGPAPAQQPSDAATATEMPPQPEMTKADERRIPDTDNWKAYEVKETKQDWSSYEVPRQEGSAQPPQQQSQPAPKPAHKAPSENEVEKALSGLTEAEAEKPAAQAPQATSPAQPTQEQQAPQAKPQAPAAEEKAEDDDKQWSLENLKKNLTNMDRDS